MKPEPSDRNCAAKITRGYRKLIASGRMKPAKASEPGPRRKTKPVFLPNVNYEPLHFDPLYQGTK